MMRFHLKRGFKDYMAHMILIALPVVLIQILSLVYKKTLMEQGQYYYDGFVLYITIGFTLLFQIYGSSYSFETIGEDLFTPKLDRLKSTGVDLQKLILSNLIISTIVSFVQSVVVLTISNFMMTSGIKYIYFILPVMFLSVAFNQILGTFILLLVKSVKKAQTITIIYGISAPIVMGLYFDLPQVAFFQVIKKYSSPMALTHTSIMGILNHHTFDIILGISVIVGLICFMLVCMRQLIKGVTK